MSLHELCSDLFLARHLFLHPWVANDVCDSQSLIGIELQHTRDEVLEVLGVVVGRLVGLVNPPEIG